MNQQQKDDIEVFARWQQLGLIEDAELVARRSSIRSAGHGRADRVHGRRHAPQSRETRGRA